ncbi:hypothetical protein [Flavobacterium eburneipallidum]|uniref:hypothetical protein n=1 Tax=Flavobacterium eburneipallidum TaxID=3003263 RepID=UPI0024823460|nr:hypothetical protein [Flavobacterium eburneipallidum]
MKKKLEADLISIAHRVLQMKNKSDIEQLYVETQKLYEKLSVLRFVEEHFGDVKPTIGQAEIIEKLEETTVTTPVANLQSETIQEEIIPEIIEEKIVIEEEIENEIVGNEVEIEHITIEEVSEEIAMEEVSEEILEEAIAVEAETMQEPIQDNFIPSFELDEEETPKKTASVQISFEDLLGVNYGEPHFVKVDHNKANPLDFELPKATNLQEERAELLAEIQVSPKDIEPKTAAIIDIQAKAINIGLNDRIAFVKHLFGNSNEDYARVLNQLITFDSFEEAQNFIEDMVKPDYNNWEGKEDYSERFIQIIEKKFA